MESAVKFSFTGIKTNIDKNGVEKKQQIGMPLWKNITETTIHPGHTAFAYRTGKISGITAFDFDTIESYEKLVSEHPELKACKTIKTKKGFHIYFQYNPDIPTVAPYFPDIDTRNDNAILYCPPTTYKLKDGTIVEYEDLGGDLLPVPDYLINPQYKKLVVKEKKKKEVLVKDGKKEKDEDVIFLKHMIEAGLLSHLSTDYSSWVKAGLAFKSIDALDLFLLFSKTSSKYDERACIEAWEGFLPSSITVASLYYWAKERDKMLYYALLERKKSLNNEYEISQVARCIVQDVFRKDDDFYAYKRYWSKTTPDDLRCIVMTELRQYLLVCLGVITKQTEIENYEEIISRLRTVLNSQINKVNGQKSILDQYRIHSPKLEIDLDTLQPYYFCFKNCAFDLRTNRRVETVREDYITQHTGYDYIEPTQEQVDRVAKLVESIFPNPEKRRFYMSVLRTGMIGLAFENMIFATGGGGNGKGLLNGFYSEMLGTSYYFKGNVNLLTEPKKQGANPEVANIHNKRMVLFSEPPDNAKIQVGPMKELTGGGTICARGLYQSECIVRLTLTCVLEYNTTAKPTLGGDIDDAIMRRLRVCDFDQSFKENPKEGEQQADPFYKTDEFTKGHRCALFKYLTSYQDVKLYDTEVIRQDTMKYFNTSDSFLSWFDSHYELTEDEDDFVSLKDMLETYKEFSRRSKKEYRSITRKSFLETFDTHFKFSLFFFFFPVKLFGFNTKSLWSPSEFNRILASALVSFGIPLCPRVA
jgi:phage/plasmid-associated DNA primase